MICGAGLATPKGSEAGCVLAGLRDGFSLLILMFSPFPGFDDSRKGAIPYYLCGFPKGKRGAVELPCRNSVNAPVEGPSSNVLSWFNAEMGHYIQVTDEEQQEAVAQGTDEE